MKLHDVARDRLPLFQRAHLTCFNLLVAGADDSKPLLVIGDPVNKHDILRTAALV